MLDYLLDIQRVRQYFNQAVRAELVLRAARADLRVLDQFRRGLLPLPVDRPAPVVDPFPPFVARSPRGLEGVRVAVIASGGSGALASVVGVARALEERGVRPVAYGVCSGSAFFGVPLAAGMPAAEVAAEVLALRPQDYIDPDWWALVLAPVRLGRGWSGLVRGDALESACRRILGDVTLGELPVPVWLPVLGIEDDLVEYLGPDTHPDLPAARAVRLALGLPIAVRPAELDGSWWLDGGIVDILPAEPFVLRDVCDLAIVVNGFYRAGFVPDREPRWRESPLSILHIANQTRTMQHLRIARYGLDDLRRSVPEVIELAPVDYGRVQGAGLYAEFLDNRRWAGYMADGYRSAAAMLSAREQSAAHSPRPARRRGTGGPEPGGLG